MKISIATLKSAVKRLQEPGGFEEFTAFSRALKLQNPSTSFHPLIDTRRILCVN